MTNDITRNYFDFHKLTPEDLKLTEQIVNQAYLWNIFTKPKKDESGEKRYRYTEEFDSFWDVFMQIEFPDIDPLTGRSRKPDFMTRAEYRAYKKKEKKTYEVARKQFEKYKKKDMGYSVGDVYDYIGIIRTVDMITTYRILYEYLDNKEKENGIEIEKIITRKDGIKAEIYKPILGPNWSQLFTITEQRIDTMSNDEYNTTLNLAQMIYGLQKMSYEREVDKLLLDRMVHFEILTNTGHLTAIFKSCLQDIAKEDKISFEEMAGRENSLFAIIVEFTRDEEYGDAAEYLRKKTDHELQEYNEMVRVVKRCIIAETVKAKEEME